jgi:hypothetical protein
MTTTRQAQENSEYVRRLLREKQPGFAATLESAERQVDQELSSHPDAGSARESSATRHKDVGRPLRLPHEGSP